jgi:hypothetical protein
MQKLNNNSSRQVLKPNSAAAFLSVSRHTLDKLTNNGILRRYELPNPGSKRRLLFYMRDELIEDLKTYQQPTNQNKEHEK